MSEAIAYTDAIDLLDADHKAVKKMFIDYSGLCEDAAPDASKRQLAERICQALTMHTRIEEEIFYPAVRKATSDDALMDEALDEHAEAKSMIAEIQSMEPSETYDEAVMKLGQLIDEHVLEEREQIFLEARYAALDLRGLAVDLFKRKKELKSEARTSMKEAA